jgi:hypothetical protein
MLLGACDLVLLHNPDFANGLGMDLHIRTKIDTVRKTRCD